jgi:hypothetical protein
MAANLTLTDNETVIQYTSTGETIFPFPFPFLANDEIFVSVDQVLSSAYTLSGLGDDAGGTVTFDSATSAGEIITIWQDMPFKRLTGFALGASTLLPEDLNTEFARLVRHDQQLRREIGLALRLQVDDPLSGQDMVIPSQSTRAGKFLAFNASGEPTVSEGSGGGDTSLRSDLASTAGSLGNQLVAVTKTGAESGVTVVGPAVDLGKPERYLANTTPGTTIMSAGFADVVSVDNRALQLFGDYKIADVVLGDNGMDGHQSARLLAASGATDVLIVNARSGDSWRYRRIKDLEIDATGDSIRTVNGITLDRAGDHLAAGLVIDGCYIKNANIAIYHPNGSIGVHVVDTTIKASNYCIFAEETTGPIQHVGASRYEGGEWSGSKKAAVYLKNPVQTTGGILFHGTIVEGNEGHGFYFDGANLIPTMIELNGVWMEANGTEASGQIDLGFGRGVESYRDIMAHDVDHIRIIGMHCTSLGWEFNNSMALLDGAFFNAASVLVRSSDSVVRCINANLEGITYLADVVIESVVQQRRASGALGATMIARIPERTHIVHSLPGTGVGVYGQSFANADRDLNGSGGTGTRTYGPLGLYDHYNKYSSLNASTNYTDDLIALVQGKWYVYTKMVRKSANDIDKLKYQNGTVHLVQGGANILDNNVADDTWVTIGGLCEFDGASGNVRLLLATDSGTVPDISFGPCQVCQFDTQGEATAYFNSGAFFDQDILEYNGVATLSGGTLAIDFSTEGFQDQPDDEYVILLTPKANTLAYVSAQSENGFTITGGTTDLVMWEVKRRNL